MKEKKIEYELLWRNKFLTVGAKSFIDIIRGLEKAVEELKEMKATRKVKYAYGAGDDYATFITTDKEIAEKFGFTEVEDYEE